MKRIIVFVCLLFSLSLKAQPAKVGGGLLPAFRMTKTTGRVFESRQLAGGRPVLLIYFAPDCDHCMVLLDAFFKKVADFKNAEIVLVTFKPVQDLLLIEKKYGTARLSNLHVGTEGLSFFLRNYYRMQK